MPSIHSACLTESLWKPQFQSHCSSWCFSAAAAFFLCPHPLPAGFFLVIMIYAALLHSFFNCGILPYLIPNVWFLTSSVITSVLASHRALHLTARLLTHLIWHTLLSHPALSLGYKQSFIGASLISPPTLILAPQCEADTWALFPWV